MPFFIINVRQAAEMCSVYPNDGELVYYVQWLRKELDLAREEQHWRSHGRSRASPPPTVPPKAPPKPTPKPLPIADEGSPVQRIAEVLRKAEKPLSTKAVAEAAAVSVSHTLNILKNLPDVVRDDNSTLGYALWHLPKQPAAPEPQPEPTGGQA